MIQSHAFEVGGKTLSVETGRVARQAGGAVLLGMGETVVLGTATMSAEPRQGIDFLPLVCDYEERKYSVGKIPGGFIKRGGRPSEKAILVSRLIDRPIRPLFPKGLRNDVQVIAMPFAVDPECPPDVLAINAAGAALAVSDVPFNGPIAGVRVGRIDGQFVLFPSMEEIERSDLDLIVAGHKGAISMVEAGANEVTEEEMHEALKIAFEAIQLICTEFEKFAQIAGKPKREAHIFRVSPELAETLDRECREEIETAICNPDKAARESALDDLSKELVAKYAERFADDPETVAQLPEAVDKVVKGTVRRLILEQDRRPDGRALDEIRPLEACAGLLPKVHGSGLFTRGQTQVMTICTLGLPNEAQIIDGLELDTEKRFMHFYNFPPYSVGEVRPLRGPGRREVGHGALAERALKPVVPVEEPDFPYTILLLSEVLESNGSTSMASVCGSTLALMDAGIKIKAPVAGIAMGLMSDGQRYKILTDIQGMEDFCGDMDFKVAGTRKGITALQLDTKLEGIPDEVLSQALHQAKKARLQILDVIEAEISAPREQLSPNAPKIITIQINPEKIGLVIGPSGATIKKITTTTGTSIDIEQDGRVLIGAPNLEAVEEAIAMIRALTDDIAIGTKFRGRVSRLMGRGAMVEFIPGREGLVPLEQLTTRSIRRPDDVVSVGDELNVVVHEIDSLGRINLTALGVPQDHPKLADNENAVAPKPTGGRPGGDRGDRGDRGGRDRGRGDRRESRGSDRRDDRSGRGEARQQQSKGQAEAPPQQQQPAQAPAQQQNKPVDVPDSFPQKERRPDDDVNARFRPRR